jgi:hypothetical protein
MNREGSLILVGNHITISGAAYDMLLSIFYAGRLARKYQDKLLDMSTPRPSYWSHYYRAR